MATLILTAAASSFGLTGFSLFAANLAAAAVGSFIDSRLFATHETQEGQQTTQISLSSSTEGVAITRLYGRCRVGGNMIWTTNFREVKHSDTQKTGKGGGSTVTTTSYTYFVSFAIAFCEGNERATIGRIWADSDLLDTNGITYRFYPGSQTQGKDSAIVAAEGEANTSAYRGIAYMVFEDLELTNFGNRIPQITAEIIVPIDNPDAEILENLLQSVNLIPSTGEVAYSTTPSIKDDGYGNAVAENIHLKADETDLELSIQDLVSNVPNMGNINLVIAWFGTDLRMNHCNVEPRVEVKENKNLEPIEWSVSGYTRSTANQVTQLTIDGEERPAFGGTPSDHSVVEAIQYLCDTQELNVLFYPFLLMDIPSGNGLPDPYGGDEQAVFPWRGRITTSDPSTVDGTSDASDEIDDFFGSAEASDFNVSGTTVTYTGSSSDKGYRRMVLHYAHLFAAAANSLDDPSRCKAFYVGTEMRGITQTRSNGTGVYPGVTKMSDLIDDVKAIFTAAGVDIEISYAADWSEYHSHRPSDGSNDVFFNMDPIWSNSNCSYIAIDNYTPISDWRNGVSHADYGTGNDSYGNPKATSIYDIDYLQGQIEGGEQYDYYYASDADRTSQTRTAIVDGAEGKHWVFRQKDFRSWWSNSHYNRPSGVESGTATDWTAASKKIVFSEFGCPAVDKGTNQPNVFYDPKSSESFLPYFSSGQRDDIIQRAFYEATITYWRDNAPTVGSVKMIDPEDMFAWTWDARPYPAFPFRSDFWSDGANWNLGHWLNGRVGVVPLGELVKIICGWVGFTDEDIDVTGLVGTNTVVRGYPITNVTSPREALNPLFNAFLFDGFETQGKIKFLLRANTPFSVVDLDDFVATDTNNPSGYQINRAQETELPKSVSLSYFNEAQDYQSASVGAQRQTTTSSVSNDVNLALVLDENMVNILAYIMLQESWSAREKLEFALPPSEIVFDPGDGIIVTIGSRELSFRLTSVQKAEALSMNAEGIDTSIYDALISGAGGNASASVTVVGKTVLRIMDLPLVTGEEPYPWAPRLAAYQGPFPPAVNIYEDTGSDLILTNQLFLPTQMGILATDLKAGPWHVIDEGNILQVDMNDPEFQVLSDTEINVRNGANAIAVMTSNGDWEVMKFVNSSLQSGRRYNLSRLFRGQLGTWSIMEDTIPAGQPVVFLDATSIAALAIPQSRKFDSIDFRYGPNVYATGSSFYQDITHVGQAVGQLPYPVADVQFFPGDGEVTFTWKRQTRFGGEDFESAEVPLNEDSERYEIDLLDGSDVLQSTVSVTSPTYTYTGAPSVFKARIYQMSASVGRGRPVTATYGA
jgi:hypothetical protein